MSQKQDHQLLPLQTIRKEKIQLCFDKFQMTNSTTLLVDI